MTFCTIATKALHYSSEFIFQICNMNTSKGTEGVNEQGGVETKVETVDFRSPAGEDKEPVKEKVEILHEIKDGGANSGNTGAAGFVGKAAIAVADTFQSAKDAVSGKPKDAVAENKTTK
ncbi:hypothetical protein ABKV19_019674 [Rosa sericea]